jgi:hypothetical protein
VARIVIQQPVKLNTDKKQQQRIKYKRSLLLTMVKYTEYKDMDRGYSKALAP